VQTGSNQADNTRVDQTLTLGILSMRIVNSWNRFPPCRKPLLELRKTATSSMVGRYLASFIRSTMRF